MQTLFPVDNRCEITVENGMLVLKSSYIHELVQAVKSLPYTERRYDGNRKVWFVDPRHGKKLVYWINLYTGETVNLPSTKNVKSDPVLQMYEVRYIGTCKPRDDGSSMAFGLVGKDWQLIFPELVLRTWFDAGEPDPTEAQTLYQVLGARKTSTDDEIKTAYRRMVKQWHPDVSKEPNSHEVFIKINEAYEILNDSNKRARYNAGLALQESYEKQSNKQQNNAYKNINNYRSPLRSGFILLEGIEKIGRLEASKILAWEDIVNSKGQTLVTSWPLGAKEPLEVWS